ncbi:MAG: hypothetical protein J4F31_07690 [Flavobacteriales bacterium]|nr:hypothetical protein [Flavobacteriales bacterium]
MKRFLLCLLFIPLISLGQNDFQILYYDLLANLGNSTVQEALIDTFFMNNPETPFISGDSAVFLHRDSASVQVAGDFTGWSPTGNDLFPIAGSTLKFRYESFEPTARLDYKLVVNGNWVLDPLNPHTAPGGFGSNSELAMPLYVQPWEIQYDPSVPAGTVFTHSISSAYTGNTYPVHVYLPPNYDSTGHYPTVYFQDGSEYRLLANSTTVLDNLIAVDSIQPVIGVFVTPNNRNEEYAFSLRDVYTNFFVEELVPFIDSMFATRSNPWSRLVLGDSFGGNISVLIAFQHNDVFGNVGFHSGAFWPDDFHAFDVIQAASIDSLRVAMIWGTYESAMHYNRGLRDNLINTNFPVYWSEYHEGHSWGLWRATLDELIHFAFQASELSLIETRNVLQVTAFPNPYSDSITFSFGDQNLESVDLKIYSVKSELFYDHVLSSDELNHGRIKVSLNQLPTGVYFAEIRYDD